VPLPRVRVVAAALFDAAGRVLLSERPAGRHMAGRWEFPGGKVAAGESEPAALARELSEELGIESGAACCALRVNHDYPDRTVELSLWIIESYRGVPRPLDGQRLKWVACAALPAEDLLEADRPFVELLRDRGAR